MTFALLPAWGVALGALALAGLLWLLQRLRAQPRVVRRATALLWAIAVREAPLTVRGRRFRYWLAYLLALAIALLLWLAAAQPQLTGSGGGIRVFYLDLTAGLVRSDAAAAAKRALIADVRAVPAASRAVYLGDGDADGRFATLLLAPGENASLLAGRLAELAPLPQPSRFRAWLARQAKALPVRYYGDWPSARGTAASFGYLAPAVRSNRGIVALGTAPAASGRWDVADVRVATEPADAAATLAWTLDGRRFAPARVERDADGGRVLRDVPAAGGALRVRLMPGDGFPADDAATLRLPDRRPVRVAVAADVPASVRAAIAADDALAIVAPDAAQVVVRTGPSSDGRPTLALLPAASQPQTFVFTGAGPGGAADLPALGLTPADAAALAQALGRPIGVGIEPGPRRSVSVWRALFDPATRFDRSPAMPVFVSQAVRWLAVPQGWRPYAKAGEAAPDQSRLYGLAAADAADRLLAGAPADADALTDRTATRAAAGAGPAPTVVPLRGGGDRLLVWLLAAALALLAAEWWLVQRGRMP